MNLIVTNPAPFRKVFFLSTVVLIVFAFCDCTKKDDESSPVIDYVRSTRKDSATATVGRGATVALIGTHLGSTQKVFFNGTEAYVNVNYVTETSVIVTVPPSTPYKNSSNQVRLVSKFGETTKDLTILQPAPVITGFNPAAGGSGDIITITGSIFDNVKQVLFGTVAGQVISVSPDGTSIQVKVPANVPNAPITVVTPGGSMVSKSAFGFKFILYDDALNNNWYSYNWASDLDVVSTEKPKRGTKSIKIAYKGGYAGLGFGTGGSGIDPTQYTAVKFSVYPDTDGSFSVNFKLNPNGTAFTYVLTLKGKQWNDVTLNLKNDLKVTSNTPFKEIQFQEWGSTTLPILYIDDFGWF